VTKSPDSYHSWYRAGLFNTVATILAPWFGGLEYIALTIALYWLRTLSAVSLSTATTQRQPTLSSRRKVLITMTSILKNCSFYFVWLWFKNQRKLRVFRTTMDMQSSTEKDSTNTKMACKIKAWKKTLLQKSLKCGKTGKTLKICLATTPKNVCWTHLLLLLSQ